MTMTASNTGDPAGTLLGSWVEAHQEPCRGGRTYRLLVNHRTGQAMELSGAEAAICDGLAAGGPPGDVDAAAFLEQLREDGFLAASPPPPPQPGRLTLSLSRLDLRWTGAGRLVQAAYARGARHLFHPAALAAQALLAVAGLAALIAALLSHQRFQLRVHPAQIPVVLGLSAAAIAVHEFAHALVVVRHHRAVDGAGLRLHLGTPAFYVESAAALLLPRPHRLIQAAAGVWAEWQFTSITAIWLWCSPVPSALPLLHRFVLLNAATIATNLLPFTGLDGSWLLADAIRIPDLARRCRGALTRLAITRATREPRAADDTALAAYSIANAAAAAALLATAGFFWYQLFGDLAATLARHGPVGWLILAAATILLAMPALSAAVPRLAAAAATLRELHAAITFRLQWTWRIPATRRLAATLTPLAALDPGQLGIIAGQLRRTRCRHAIPAGLATGSYGLLRAGTITATTGTGQALTLTPGTTWTPHHALRRASRRATLIHIGAHEIRQLISSPPGQ
ncbi:MAG: hypothetical protein ACRDPF_08740 [Streptosporangiaceae bacterium]